MEIGNDRFLLASIALSSYCGTKNAGDDCLRFTNVEEKGFIYFNNASGNKFRLECNDDGGDISCGLSVRKGPIKAGCGCDAISSGYSDTGVRVEMKSSKEVPGRDCVNALIDKKPKEESRKISLKPEIENFYKNVDIYFDGDTKDFEEEGFIETLKDAAHFVAGVMKEHIGLKPLSDSLYIHLDHRCNEENAPSGGYTLGNYMRIITPLCPPVYGPLQENRYGAVLAHELTHAYIFPRLADDPGSIVHEGLAVYIQATYVKKKGFFDSYITVPGLSLPTSNELFPEAPAEALYIKEGVAPGALEVNDRKGKTHKIELVDISDKGVRYFLDGSFVERWTGFGVLDCTKDSLCLYFERNGIFTDLTVFDASDARVRQVIKAPEGCGISPGVIYLLPNMRILRGADKNGVVRYFSSAEQGKTICGFPTYLYPLFDQGKEPPAFEQYYPAFIMFLGLEQMFREHYPNKDPNTFLKVLGGVHTSFREDVYSRNAINIGVNIYHDICSRMELPAETCLGYFNKFGIDTGMTYASDWVMCMPD